MKRLIKGRTPSPAFVIACIALFASMGGVSYAVATGSIDSREIKDNTIRSKDMRSSSITAREIKRRSLDGTDIKIERVGGNAVKEQVLEVDKLPNIGKYTTRWALVNEAGQIEQQTGGFTIVNCFQANANCYINAGEDVTNNGLSANIAVANTDGSPILNGETGVAPCGAAFVACAPPGTENATTIVVAPRSSDGTAFGAGNRARFYVQVTGTEAVAATPAP